MLLRKSSKCNLLLIVFTTCLLSSPGFTKQSACGFEGGPDVFLMIIFLKIIIYLKIVIYLKNVVSHRHLGGKKNEFLRKDLLVLALIEEGSFMSWVTEQA